ncbi:hypothetical protein PtrSN002B_010765 [Pyrenophora tritici-repentis]|uniref:Uncharacterized protein n=2 Tax=Pyrenophora tritici-repentis TaxID=45151 RepID=A0A2W1CT73_9PLEO|nr:uncharacterized protein PTRG_04850 [Pyrenophora tritici-repentis Pt-1C-BFP]KAA8612364.1 hypothetical protein PtrV1_12933 [Pyrenophora tritici-repentis]EDU47757.1 conserved hypothetical protein [Pyrenophora tritici-repentis Pt-1C-BFP]KAF7447109.1 hypothetical protein A1F99_085560 [Pyrenophora tritici-repentis]KAF7569403.1 hypothetical protein PtrM4_118180 [Pyrenophora tritici-repentis]KAG9382829.1 hypothetical protein A1F94_006750 [Pyrenophora tritici-repentis]
MVSFVALLALSASALASPVALQERDTNIPNNWYWKVLKWDASCIRSLCTYRFDVTIPSADNIAGVSARCSGYENGGYKLENWYADCDIVSGPKNNGVAAKLSTRLGDSDSNPSQIFVSFVQVGDGKTRPTFNYTGRADVIYPHSLFDVGEFDIVAENATAIL